MTGAEIGPLVGAGKAVAAVGKKAAGETAEDRAQLARLAEETPEMRAAAEVYARRKLLVQQVRLKVLQPLGLFAGLKSDYFEVKFPEDLAAKLEGIPEEDLRPPRPSVAGPVLNGLAYSHTEDELKELYLNLLATASNAASQDAAHPAFAAMIQQLTAEEATLLTKTLRVRNSLPMVDFELETEGKSGAAPMLQHLLDWSTITGEPARAEEVNFARYVDNWLRLGLVATDPLSALTREGAYEWAETHPATIHVRDALKELNQGQTLKIQHRILRATALGDAFRDAVVPPHGPEGPEVGEEGPPA